LIFFLLCDVIFFHKLGFGTTNCSCAKMTSVPMFLHLLPSGDRLAEHGNVTDTKSNYRI